ncbi:hypothetical protein AGLY_002893 [Aphis glycines]|uniref:Uncharacterized protein n=1 Tax=Aphis glycines TaxID=307491 RepID=A0A6G0U3X4_APHGL|nr:hypothetical protein AGLY_002893 [Aphis glycines]
MSSQDKQYKSITLNCIVHVNLNEKKTIFYLIRIYLDKVIQCLIKNQLQLEYLMHHFHMPNQMTWEYLVSSSLLKLSLNHLDHMYLGIDMTQFDYLAPPYFCITLLRKFGDTELLPSHILTCLGSGLASSTKSMSGIEITGGSSPIGSTFMTYVLFIFVSGLDEGTVTIVVFGSNNSSVGDTDTSLIKSSNGEFIIISFGANISSTVEPPGLLNICETLLGLKYQQHLIHESQNFNLYIKKKLTVNVSPEVAFSDALWCIIGRTYLTLFFTSRHSVLLVLGCLKLLQIIIIFDHIR